MTLFWCARTPSRKEVRTFSSVLWIELSFQVVAMRYHNNCVSKMAIKMVDASKCTQEESRSGRLCALAKSLSSMDYTELCIMNHERREDTHSTKQSTLVSDSFADIEKMHWKYLDENDKALQTIPTGPSNSDLVLPDTTDHCGKNDITQSESEKCSAKSSAKQNKR